MLGQWPAYPTVRPPAPKQHKTVRLWLQLVTGVFYSQHCAKQTVGLLLQHLKFNAICRLLGKKVNTPHLLIFANTDLL